MMVMGGGVNGGRVAGRWAGLDSLDEGDLPVTTDYRQVLGELVARRLGGGDALGSVFPGYAAGGWLGPVRLKRGRSVARAITRTPSDRPFRDPDHDGHPFVGPTRSRRARHRQPCYVQASLGQQKQEVIKCLVF